MPLFAKNRPTERLNFEGGFVELQYLSKGVKDEIKRRSSEALASDLDPEIFKKIKSGEIKDDAELPASAFGSVGKFMQIEYYKLARAIVKWSDGDTPITEETVKELDEEIFNQISKKVDDMNSLKQVQEKN
jgi:hypothetical protein